VAIALSEAGMAKKGKKKWNHVQDVQHQQSVRRLVNVWWKLKK
jgi:hypothetical protein